MAARARRSEPPAAGGRCWVITGDDGLLIDRALARVLEEAGGKAASAQTFWAPEKPKKPLARWSAEQHQRLRDTLTSLSLFGARTLVVIKGADRLDDADLDRIASVFNAQGPEAALVFVCENEATRHRIAKRIAGRVTELKANSPSSNNPANVQREIARLAGELGHGIEPQACDLLHDLVGENLLALRGQLEKVSIVVGNRGHIGTADVAAVVGGSRVREVWDLVNAIGRRDAKEALKLAGEMVEDTNEFPNVVGAIASVFRRMWLAKEAQARGMQSRGGGGAAHRDGQRAQLFDQAELAAALDTLARSDLAFKQGRGKARWLLEEFILKMCRLAPRPRPSPDRR